MDAGNRDNQFSFLRNGNKKQVKQKPDNEHGRIRAGGVRVDIDSVLPSDRHLLACRLLRPNIRIVLHRLACERGDSGDHSQLFLRATVRRLLPLLPRQLDRVPEDKPD